MASQPKPREDARVPLSRERVLDAAIGLADDERDRVAHHAPARAGARRRGDVAVLLRRQQGRDPERHRRRGRRRERAAVARGRVEGRRFAGPRSPPTRSSCGTRGRPAWCCRAPGVSGARLRYMNSILGSLREAGFSAEMTDHAYHALESHIMGFTLWEVGMNLGSAEELAAMATTFLEQLSRRRVPVPGRARRAAPQAARSERRGRVRVRARPDPRRARAAPRSGLTPGYPAGVHGPRQAVQLPSHDEVEAG